MIGGGELWKLLEFLAREKQKPQRPSSAAAFELTAKLPAGMHHLLLETAPASQDAQGEGENRVIDISGLRRLLAGPHSSLPWTVAEVEDDCYVANAEGDGIHSWEEDPHDAYLFVAAVNALPELLDEVERLQGVDRDADKLHARYKERVAELERQNTDLQRRNTELVERNRQLEAAVDAMNCACPHLIGCDGPQTIVKALKEKAE